MLKIAQLFIVFTLMGPMMCFYRGIEREVCDRRVSLPYRKHSDQRHRVDAIREEMKMRASMRGSAIDAYIVSAWDEHLNENINDHDKRVQFISGFTGKNAHVVITQKSVALWTDEKYLDKANSELNCDWKIFALGSEPSLPEFLLSELEMSARVGCDPRTVPHKLWLEWEAQLQLKYIRVIRLNHNLIDLIWLHRPKESTELIQVHPLKYAGEKWQNKIQTLRKHLVEEHCDAMVVTSLTEIAYLLNLRGSDVPYKPVFKAYLLVSQTDTFLYVNNEKIDMAINLHLNVGPTCNTDECVKIKDYNEIWKDLRSCSHVWRRILVPGQCVFDLGVSEAIYSSILQTAIHEKPSPVIFMRAQKNPTEQKAMQRAHIIDGAAMCEALSLLERRFLNGEQVTEVSASNDIDFSRYSARSNRGLSFKTTVAFGPHAAIPHFETFNETDIGLTDKEPCIIDSGGQYSEGTTIVSRTLHFGEPTFEQKQMYTNVLRAIIRLSTLVFPEHLSAAEIDALARSAVWDAHNDYPQITGHGIGSFLSVQESPIKISYTEPRKYSFKEGYFFSSEPGLYKKGLYGVRLKNVLEVYDTGDHHISGARFMGFRDVSLVPFEPKLIDRGVLSLQEKQWLNNYNARIRTLVGEDLKTQFKMQAFYWMMNKTMHVIEYYPESEYRQRNEANSIAILLPSTLCMSAVLAALLALIY